MATSEALPLEAPDPLTAAVHLAPGPSARLLALVPDWTQLDELRLACRSSEPNYRRHHALSSLLACSREEMVAALLAQRSRTPSTPAREDCSLAALVLGRHEALATLLHG